MRSAQHTAGKTNGESDDRRQHGTRTPRPVSPAVGLVILLAVVAVIVTTTHWPSLSCKALSFDDQQYLTENYLVQHPSWASAKRFLGEVLAPSTVGGYYQPLAMISLMCDYAVAGDVNNLRPFHRTSLTLHVMNTMLIIVLLYMLFRNPWVAAMVGLLFGVHPLTIEPIPWVAERKTLLAAFFALWSLILYVRYVRRPTWTYYLACAVTYLLAILSKPSATPLPAVMFLLDFWPLRRVTWRTALEKVPLLVLAVASAQVTYVSQSRTAVAVLPTEYYVTDLLLVLCHNVVFYLRKIVWPMSISWYYPLPEPLALSNHVVLRGVIGTCILIPALLLSLRWTRALLVGWLIFFVAILPTMQLVGFTVVVAADRFAYLPLIGLLLVLGWALNHVWRMALGGHSLAALRVSAVTVVVVLSGVLGVLTQRYLSCWHDTASLDRYMLKVAPDVPELHSALGNVLFEEHNRDPSRQDLLDDAIAHWKEAIHLRPELAEPYNNLGLALGQQGKLEQSVAYLKEALRLSPNYAEAHNNLGNALADQGRIEEAIGEYRDALRVNPNYPRAHANMADVLLRLGRAEEAAAHYVKALEIAPGLTYARIGLGHAFRAQHKTEQALAAYKQAADACPDDPGIRFILAVALHESGQFDQAVEQYRAVLKLEPDREEAARLLTAAIRRQKPPAVP